jgi:hypothetical protein
LLFVGDGAGDAFGVGGVAAVGQGLSNGGQGPRLLLFVGDGAGDAFGVGGVAAVGQGLSNGGQGPRLWTVPASVDT